MYYLTDIDTDGKVNTIINLPSEKYIEYLGWDKTQGAFVEELPPVANDGYYTSICLYFSDNAPWWKYGDIIIPEPPEPPLSEVELLKAQNKALSDRLEFTEDLIAEMAMKVYTE